MVSALCLNVPHAAHQSSQGCTSQWSTHLHERHGFGFIRLKNRLWAPSHGSCNRFVLLGFNELFATPRAFTGGYTLMSTGSIGGKMGVIDSGI